MRKKELAFIGSPSNNEHIDKLAPEMPKEVKNLLIQFKARNSEIENWLRAEPDRHLLLQKDPQVQLNTLFTSMGLEPRQNPKRPKLSGWNFTIRPKPTYLGLSLLVALWQYVTSSSSNIQQFVEDPFQSIDMVASNTNSSAEEKTALVKAFEAVLGVYHKETTKIDAFNMIPHDLVPT